MYDVYVHIVQHELTPQDNTDFPQKMMASLEHIFTFKLFSFSPFNSRYLQFMLYRAQNVPKAYDLFLEVLRNHTKPEEGRSPWSDSIIETTKGKLIYSRGERISAQGGEFHKNCIFTFPHFNTFTFPYLHLWQSCLLQSHLPLRHPGANYPKHT